MHPASHTPPSRAVDWGTSSFRAYCVARDGAVLNKRSAPLGILAIEGGRFAEALETQVRDWLEAGEQPIVMSGMIGGRQGWKEPPYAHCLAGLAEIAAAMVQVQWTHHRAWSRALGVQHSAPGGPLWRNP
jgi:2-dehydro-3-deoxygalactonokinase